MDKLDWHGMANEFGQKVYKIVKSEEKTNGLCRISINTLMEMVGVKNGMHKDMFWWGVRKYLCPTGMKNDYDDDWAPVEQDEFTLISFERFKHLKAKENLELFEEELI